MRYDQTRAYLLNKPEAREDFPYGPDFAVFRLRDTMFAILCVRDAVARVNLKCDPDQAWALRDIFPSVTPGYHMNKRHRNTILLDDGVPVSELHRMIDQSYNLVLSRLKKSHRESLIQHSYPDN